MIEQNYEQDILRIWDTDEFERQIVNAVKGHDIPIKDFPRNIILNGKYQTLFDKLMQETLSDPDKKERGIYAKVASWEEKLKIVDEVQVGFPDHVDLDVDLKYRILVDHPHYRPSEYKAFSVHTHGIADRPPSPSDTVNLLKATEDWGNQAIIVLTPSIQFLIVRTLETPHLSVEEVQTISNNWSKEHSEKLDEEATKLGNFMKAYGGVSTTQLEKISMQFQMDMLKKFCEKHQLMLYVSTEYNGQFSKVTG